MLIEKRRAKEGNSRETKKDSKDFKRVQKTAFGKIRKTSKTAFKKKKSKEYSRS